ncbi:unnamed protein product [Phytophthora lilii]|uniref:Unnamed protein product n=1 Tax=Phytophthora lilii TaxID=2077276 RepID=A0A9W6XCC6_9STRA|nr:unnamed protein product [Phytophthora lilii]
MSTIKSQKKLLKCPKGPPEIIKVKRKKLPNLVKKHTYVPQSTDADANMEEPTAPEDSSEDFYGGVMTLPKRLSILEHPSKEKRLCVRWWMITFENALTSTKSFEERIQIGDFKKWQVNLLIKSWKKSVKLLKRKRTENPPNKSPSDKRAAKRAAKRAEDEPSIY